MNSYVLIKNFISDDIVDFYYEKSKNYTHQLSKVGTTVQEDKKRRTDIFFNSNDCQLLDKIIFLNKKYLIESQLGIQLNHRETYKLGTYSSSNKGFYNPHRDTQGGPIHRKISMVICLSNDSDYQGGLFRFIELNKSFKFDKGDALFFDSDLLHGVEPVTSGTRQVIISFMWDHYYLKKPNTEPLLC